MEGEPKIYLVDREGVIIDAGESETDLINQANAEGLEDFETTESPVFTQGVYVGEGNVVYPDAEEVARLKRIFG